ncbi:MAG: hemL [Oscillospiraceae bacterium]|nr:hemL [Oscillospiraceae bacterium]
MNSLELFNKAKEIIPGGVNSPVRAFKSVGLNPPFIQKGKGSKIYDVEGNEYIDYVCSWGPMVLGHLHPQVQKAVEDAVKDGLTFGAPTEREVEIAQLICDAVPSIEMVRLVSSGTEAVMSALRLAKGYTGRQYIVKFSGCYHGHTDSMLVKAGSGLLTAGIPDSNGVSSDTAGNTLIAEYNNIESVKILFEQFGEQIAAIIVEPIAGNMGVVNATREFLEYLREITTKNGSLLIFDEVISGFRASYGGAQALFGILPDLTTLGKIIGGGMPCGAYGGSKEIMSMIAPVGSVYQAGTLSGNPISTAAGIATLKVLKQDEKIYQRISQKADVLVDAYRTAAKKYGVDVVINQAGSVFTVFFTNHSVVDYQSALTSDTKLFAMYFKEMLSQGIYLAPSQFEAVFVSDALSEQDIQKTIDAIDQSFRVIAQ